jgi:hypothetical protein
MKVEELEAKVKALENQLRTLQDIEEIKKLQSAYGYYLEHWMAKEVIDCFADGPDTVLQLWVGTFQGKEGVRRYFSTFFGNPEEISPEFMHQVMQLSPIIDVDPDGKTAKGRWYGWGSVAVPSGGGVTQSYMSGIYEMDYVKVDGKWRIKTLRFSRNFIATPAGGWVKPERLAAVNTSPKAARQPTKPDIQRPFEPGYPSGYIFPFHYNHPVTGKKTTEGKRNSSLNLGSG